MSRAPLVARLLRDLARVMTAMRARWYVFGAQAVVAYSRPRATADVDVTVELSRDRLHECIDRMRSSGFEPRVDDLEAFIARCSVIPFFHVPAGTPLDLVLAGPGLELDFLERARPVKIGSLTVPMISPEDLLVTKLLAARPKDLEDVRSVLRARGESLDVSKVRDALLQVEEALGQSDLVLELERAIAAVRRRAT